jgi:type II secretory pathway component PulF
VPFYSYTGLDASGQEQRGRLQAGDEKEAARLLRSRSIYLTKMSECGGPDGEKGGKSIIGRLTGLSSPARYLPVSGGDLTTFYRQLALMLRAGFTLVSALEACSELQSKLALRRAMERMNEKIRRGESFSASITEEKKIFPPMATNLIASGERSGNLDAILDRLAENVERSRELKRQLIAAMFYPSFVLVAAVGVIVVMVIYVIPRFATFLTARKAALPASTQTLLDISGWALRWGGIVAAVFGLAVFAVLAAYTTRRGKTAVDKVILRLPLIGSTVMYAAMAQVGWSMSMLLKSGITALDSLRIVSRVVGNLAVAGCFKNAAEELLQGQSLSKTLEHPYIPLMMRRMASVGEKSGHLDTVMHSVGEYYQKELVARLKFLTVTVEPALILVAGGLVFYVYYALFQAVMAVSKGGMR